MDRSVSGVFKMEQEKERKKRELERLNETVTVFYKTRYPGGSLVRKAFIYSSGCIKSTQDAEWVGGKGPLAIIGTFLAVPFALKRT